MIKSSIDHHQITNKTRSETDKEDDQDIAMKRRESVDLFQSTNEHKEHEDISKSIKQITNKGWSLSHGPWDIGTTNTGWCIGDAADGKTGDHCKGQSFQAL